MVTRYLDADCDCGEFDDVCLVGTKLSMVLLVTEFGSGC
jgi:hypothetical protein